MDEIEPLYEQAVATEEPDRAGQPAAGGFDRQAARRAGRELLRAGQRRQHVADPGGGEVRLRPRQQVQHVRQLGDHEELRPHDSRRASRSAIASARARRRCSAATEDERSDQYEQERAQSQREAQIGKILERLDEREQKIIISRFGLDHGQEPLTLKEVGRRDGRDQGADPPDRGPGFDQAAAWPPRKKRSTCRARN